MQPSGQSVAWSGFDALTRVLSLARGLLTLVGLLAIIAAATPAPGDWMLRRAAGLGQIAAGAAGSISAVGEIQGEERGSLRERRAVTEFIARRYRIAEQAIASYVAAAYRAGAEHRVDPLLILAVAAVESRFNPVAESTLGARGLMQVIPRFHADKLAVHGGGEALLDPEVNIDVGAQILREYLRRFGETETALQVYAGAVEEPNLQYAGKVLAERSRIEQLLIRLRRGA